MSGNYKAPEKSNFVQTCNLLSQYLKGKVSIRDLSLGIGNNNNTEIAGKSEMSHSTTTVDFLSNIEKSSEEMMKSADPIPQNTPTTLQQITNAQCASKDAPKEPNKTSQLTIFYLGKVMVFDEFPADKARAVMLLASEGNNNPRGSASIFHTTNVDEFDQNRIVSAPKPPVDCPATPPQPPPQPQPAETAPSTNGSDLPIARRSSLHRFLEKRKDRAIARAPYQVHNNPLIPSKNEGSSSKNEHRVRNHPSLPSNSGGSSSKVQDHIDLNFKL